MMQEAERERYGAPLRDLSSYTEWRDEVEIEVERAFDFYGTYLIGQTSGLSDALDLGAVRAALEIEDVPREEWPEETRRLLQVHNEVMKIVRREQKAKASRG